MYLMEVFEVNERSNVDNCMFDENSHHIDIKDLDKGSVAGGGGLGLDVGAIGGARNSLMMTQHNLMGGLTNDSVTLIHGHNLERIVVQTG